MSSTGISATLAFLLLRVVSLLSEHMKKVHIQVFVAVTLLFSGASWADAHLLPRISEATVHLLYIEGSPGNEIKLAAEQVPTQRQSLRVQKLAIIQELYPGEFYPSKITVKKGLPVKIYITTTDSEHINRVSIQPFVSSSGLLEPGKVTVIEFTPDRVGEFKIRNIGHGFEGTLIVEE